MSNVFDTARYILKTRGKMSTMKLQKLCYYAQAWSLVWDDNPLFDEEFEAWANGPVCPELYRATRGMFSVTESDEKEGDDDLSSNQIDTIDTVLEFYGDKDAQWLSRLTHKEEPWKSAREGCPDGAPSTRIITKESMAKYYGGL